VNEPKTRIYDTTCYGCLENPRGHNRGYLTRKRNGPNIHKGMTPPLTQNLKAVGLWVFFFIYCLTFSFLFNVRLRLTSIPNNLPLKWESTSYEPVTIRSVRTFGSDTTYWENPRGYNRGDLTRKRNGPNIHKRMTPPLTQNLKAVGLWVFFLIYCLTFSFLFNVRLRLLIKYIEKTCFGYKALRKQMNHVVCLDTSFH